MTDEEKLKEAWNRFKADLKTELKLSSSGLGKGMKIKCMCLTEKDKQLIQLHGMRVIEFKRLIRWIAEMFKALLDALKQLVKCYSVRVK